MTLKNLTAGMRIPNYKKLCFLLEEPAKEGNSKIAQLNEFSRYFSFSREKNAYLIEKIFETPTAYSDGRQHYIEFMEPLILHHLNTGRSINGMLSLEATPSKWYTDLGLVNEAFYNKHRQNEMLRSLNGGSYPLFVVRGIVSKKAKEIFLSSLRNMQRRGLLTYREAWVTIDKYDMRRIATKTEVTAIEQMRTDALSEVGCSQLAMIFKSPKRYQAFSEKFHEKISKRWRTAFKVIEVRASAEICVLHQNIPTDQLENHSNQELCNAVLKKIHQLKKQQDTADQERYLQENTWAQETPTERPFRLAFDFTWEAEVLVDQLLFVKKADPTNGREYA